MSTSVLSMYTEVQSIGQTGSSKDISVFIMVVVIWSEKVEAISLEYIIERNKSKLISKKEGLKNP